MKKILFILLVLTIIIGCSSTNQIATTNQQVPTKVSDTIKIENKELEYEVIIIDSGFSSWLASYAKPRGFYSESYLESRNNTYVTEWNMRAMQPQRYNNLYDMQINYDRNIHYGYEVNYLIYNYLIYFQITNNQKLAGFVPRP